MVWGCNSVGRVFAYHGQSSAGVAVHTCSLAAGGGPEGQQHSQPHTMRQAWVTRERSRNK